MKEKNPDRFARKLLRCLPDKYRTAKEVHEVYNRLYPPSFLRRGLGLSPSLDKVIVTLDELYMLGLVDRSSSNYLEKALDHETTIYKISYQGKQSIAPKVKG
jgi:hypothetical protein